VREVVITGVGVVSSLGHSRGLFSERLFAGVSGVGPVTRFDASRFNCRLAAEVDEEGLEAASGPYSHEIERMDRFIRYSLVASRGAIAESGIAEGGKLPEGGAIYMGVGMGGLPHIEAGVLRQEAQGPRRTVPYLIPSLIPNMAAALVGLDLAFQGPQYTFTSACSSGNQALGEAFYAIRTGRLAWALSGGTEAVITPITFSGFQAMRALSTQSDASAAPRPFDRRRDGMIVGEGAALFVLEDRQHAEARSAHPLGKLAGYATTGGGGGITLRCSTAAARCMAAALEDAGLEAGDIEALFAQAPGMAHDDRELEAIRTTFYDAGARPAVTSTEGHIGHTFGASGPLSLAAALSALARQEIPPTLKLDEPAPGYEDLDLVLRRRPARLTHCLVNSFGFGGVNASLVCTAPDPIPGQPRPLAPRRC
jgi:3-oxoacyl-[acyl-carrier-protein] synthase II